MQENKRIDYMDIAKGVAVLLVIFGHTFRESMRADAAWCDIAYLFVYRFHVALLFMLSGMGYALTKARKASLTTGAYLKKKAKTLLLPWVTYSVLIYVVFAAVQLVPPVRAMLASSAYAFVSPPQYLLAMLKNDNPYCFHMWYLQTLFLYVMVAFLADKWLGARARVVKWAAIALVPAFYMLVCEGWVWVFKAFFQKLLFFLVGTLLTDGFIRRYARRLCAVGAACGVLLAGLTLYPPTKWYASWVTGLPLGYAENAVTVGWCVGIVAACCLLEQPLRRLAAFGRHTMPYYVYHQPLCGAFLGIVLYEKLHLPALATVAACMAAGLAVPFVIIKLADKWKWNKWMQAVGLPT